MVTSSSGKASSGVKTNGGRNSAGLKNGSSLRTHGAIRTNGAVRINGSQLPLRGHAERALNDYFASLNGHRPAHLYDMVLHEVEEPLFRAVLDYASGNQSRAAEILGINRGTLRKKLRALGLSD